MAISLIIFGCSFLITWLYRIYAIHKSVLDIPNDRSSHTIPTPRGGGIAVALAWVAGLIYFFLKGNLDSGLFCAFLCGLPLSVVGLADDMIGLKPLVRFIVQFVSAGMGLYFLGGIQIFDLGLFHFDLSNSNILFYAFNVVTFVAILWSINLFNFLDGIDAYIGTEFVFLGFSIFLLTGDKLGLLLAGAVGGFLIWNWPKAKIFMGDVGSTLLGFIVAMVVIHYQNTEQISVVVMLILTSVFWFDATITLLRRIQNKEKLSEAHCKHAFQRVVQAGWSHKKTTLYSLGLNMIGLFMAALSIHFSNYSCVFLFIQILILGFALRFIDKRKPFMRSNQ